MFLVVKADYLPQGKMIGLRQGKIIYAGPLGHHLPLDIDQLLLSARDYDQFQRHIEKTEHPKGDSHVDPASQRPDGDSAPDDSASGSDPGRPIPVGDPAQS